MTEALSPIVLLVEDNPDTRFIVTELLIDLAVTTCYEVDSYQAVQTWVTTTPYIIPDIVLIDLQLPDADGYAVLHYLRNQDYMAHVRMVAFTAHVFASDLQRIRAAGFDGFIGKPIEEQVFIHTIQQLLNGEDVWLYQSREIEVPADADLTSRVAARMQPQRDTYITTVRGRIPWISEVWTSVCNGYTTVAAVAPLQQNVHYLAGSAAMLGFASFGETLRMLDGHLCQIIEDCDIRVDQKESITHLVRQLVMMVDELPHTPVSWDETET
ncbi:MAG: response regulator [Chloroflexota bacterium]